MSQASLQTQNIDLEEINYIAFDTANSTLAVSILSNNSTEYNVLFYGLGWTFTEIDNWDNTGEIFIQDEACCPDCSFCQ